MSSKIEEITAFVNVVEYGGFTNAAEKLGIAKSSLSRRMSELEQRLGVQLLNRTTRKISLTRSGQQFFERSRQILTELEEAEQLVSEGQVELKGRIKMAVPLSFAMQHMAPLIVEFKRQYPDIELSVDLNDREIDLVEEGFDLAIRIGFMQDSTLIARRLGVIKVVCCASPSYLELHGEPQHPDQLPQHYGLYYSNSSAQRLWQFEVGGKSRPFLPINNLSANNGEFLASAAIEGLGVISSPTFIVYKSLRNGELVRILKSYPMPDTGIYAVFPPGRLIPVRVRALVDFLQGYFGENPYWDQ